MKNVHLKRNVNHLLNVRIYNTYYEDGEIKWQPQDKYMH